MHVNHNDKSILLSNYLAEQMASLTIHYFLNQYGISICTCIKQLLDEVEHDIMNFQNQGLCYLPKPKAEADNTDMRF